MAQFDHLAEKVLRGFASRTSRRSVFSVLGTFLAGAALPLLPVARAAEGDHSPADPNSGQAPPQGTGNPQDPGDPTKCDYWRYCAIDGVLCGCCGGGVHTCPPGAEPSPISWIGTCVNPDDGRSYVIAYRDCCGKPVCQAGKDCDCQSVDRELPTYRQQLNNDIIWCFGNATANYPCSAAALVGLAG